MVVMDSKNRQSVALFDEDSDIEYEDTSTKGKTLLSFACLYIFKAAHMLTASLLPPAEVEGKSSDDQKVSSRLETSLE